MYDWKSQFGAQRRDYIRRTLERLAAMESILQTIAQYPQENNHLRELSQHFHQLAGSSAIYELDTLGETAAAGEKVCLNVLRNGEGVNKSEWKTLKDMIESMQFMVARHPDMQDTANVAPSATISGHTNAQASPASGGGWSSSNPATSGWNSEQQRSSGGWAAPQSLAFAGSPTPFEKAKDILVVDGDQSNLMTYTRALEEAGMQVRGFRTSDSARKALHDRLPDGLILCLPLVDSPGYEVAAELRRLPDGNVPPIMIMSRQAGFLDKVTAIRCGADGLFDQTAEPAIVVKKLQNLFERDKPSNYRILSVEDDPDQATMIRQILESVGYRVEQVSDPRQFEEALLAVNPDLLLLDVMLGPVSGFELARFVRSDDRYAATPIIFLTTQNQLNAHVESARVGGDEHLIKPVAPPLLLASVAGRLERARVLKRLIGRDGLTQFFTLSTFMEAGEKILSKRYQGSGAMVMLLIDIDHMELINDTHGFAAGDRVIASLAKLLKQNLRNAEVLARIDGDEFAVIVSDVDDRELAEVATQIISDFEKMQHQGNGKTFNATISAGAASLDLEMDLKKWIGSAQLALKSAKAGGRNRVMKAKPRTARH